VAIGYLPVTNDELLAVYDQSDISRAADAIAAVHNRKFAQELSFLRFMIFTVTTCTFQALIEGIGVPDQNQRVRLSEHSAAILESNDSLLSERMRTALDKGYQTNDVQRCVKREFGDLFSCLVYVWCATRHTLASGRTISDVLSAPEAEKDQIKKFLRKDTLASAVIDTENPFAVLSKNKYRNQLRTAIASLSQFLEGTIHGTPRMLKYMISRLEKMLFGSGTIEKNDILDMLIVISLALPDARLLTRDRQLRKFLEKHHRPSAKLLKKLSDEL
jgi:hypothetical protein